MQPSHIHGKMTSMSLLVRLPIFLRGLGLLPILAVTLAAAQLIPVPLNNIRWHGAQTLVVESGTTVLIAALLARARSYGSGQKRLLVTPLVPLLCLFLLLAWGIISYTASTDKPFALQGGFQLGAGIFVVFLVQRQVCTQAQLTFVLDALLGVGFLVAVSGFALFGGEGLTIATGILHDHMLFGAFLMLLLPLCLAVSIAPLTLNRRLFAQAAGVACQAALLAAQTRSAWVGEGVSLVMFGLLAWKTRSAALPHFTSQAGTQRKFRRNIGAAAAFIACAGAFFWTLPDRDGFIARAKTLTTTVAQGKDASTQWRVSAWVGAEKMIREKPFQGLGVGCYARHQFPYTQLGRTPEQVSRRGPTILDEAHNSYLQLWAELGIVGLALWLAALVSFLIAGIHALKRYPARSLPQWALIGCLSALTGQMVDALANPAWQFANVALPLWIILGLIAALTCPVEAAEKRRHGPRTVPVQIGQAVLAAGVGGGLLWVIYQTAFALPAPHL